MISRIKLIVYFHYGKTDGMTLWGNLTKKDKSEKAFKSDYGKLRMLVLTKYKNTYKTAIIYDMTNATTYTDGKLLEQFNG